MTSSLFWTLPQVELGASIDCMASATSSEGISEENGRHLRGRVIANEVHGLHVPDRGRLEESTDRGSLPGHVDVMRAAARSGTIQSALHGKGRAIFLLNAESERDVDTFFRSAPLADQMKHVVEPLEDFFEHARRIHGYLLEKDAKPGA